MSSTVSTSPDALLQVQDLQVAYRRPGGRTQAVRGVSFDVARGQTVALVGESGSGKTTIGRAILGLHTSSAGVSGRIMFDGADLLRLGTKAFRDLRGRRIALIPQDPLAGLNPVHTVGQQVAEVLGTHGLATRAQARELAIQAMERAGLDEAAERYGHYPHQLSGGQRQRVLIAIALIGEPDLIIADEPTSALDVTVQRRILDHIQTLVRDSGAALLLITHDLGVATDRADRVVVLSDGELLEEVDSASFLTDAVHPYSRRLAAAAPQMDSIPLVSDRGVTDLEDPGSEDGDEGPARALIEAHGLRKTFPVAGRADFVAVDAVDLSLHRGQSLGVVGESGSGKTTLARIVLGLTTPDGGSLQVGGQERGAYTSRAGRRYLHRLVQPVFQDPFSSLDPSHTVASSIAEPLRSLGNFSAPARRRRVSQLLDQVRLPAGVARRKPYELSGGQLQRVAIARALAIQPEVLVCDEPVSSLDVSIQDQILRLLADLRADSDVAYLFISHDLAVVRQICTDVLVMRHGKVVERGRTLEVFADPQNAYTRELIAAIPGSRHAIIS